MPDPPTLGAFAWPAAMIVWGPGFTTALHRHHAVQLVMQQAMCELGGGAKVTTAAQNAGFSDAAHLTRTFRRMLGLTPTELQLHRRASRGFAERVHVRLVPLFAAETYPSAVKAS